MKTFGYTLRDKEGVLKKGTLKAVDRGDVLQQIKAMGCIPVSVIEVKDLIACTHAPWNPTTWNRIVWVAIAGSFLIAALSVWLTSAKRPAPITAAVGSPPRGVRSALSTNQTVSIKPASKPVPPPSPIGTSPQGVRDETVLPEPAVVSEKIPRQTPVPQPAAQEQKPKRPRAFKNITEGLLSMALSVPPGSPVPPLPIPPNIEVDFAKSLTNDIVIYDDDDERTAELKENVAVAKNQMLEMVKQGKSVKEVLTEYQNTANEQSAVRRKAQIELNKLYRSGAVPEAQKYKDEINSLFNELSIAPIDFPKSRQKK